MRPLGSLLAAAAFGENQGRYLVAVSEGNAESVIRQATAAGVIARVAAYIEGDEIVISGEEKLRFSSFVRRMRNGFQILWKRWPDERRVSIYCA